MRFEIFYLHLVPEKWEADAQLLPKGLSDIYDEFFPTEIGTCSFYVPLTFLNAEQPIKILPMHLKTQIGPSASQRYNMSAALTYATSLRLIQLPECNVFNARGFFQAPQRMPMHRSLLCHMAILKSGLD